MYIRIMSTDQMTRVTNRSDLYSLSGVMIRAAHTARGTVVGRYTFLGADDLLVRWDDDTAPGASKGRRTSRAAVVSL